MTINPSKYPKLPYCGTYILLVMLCISSYRSWGQVQARKMEYLTRGLVAVQNQTDHIFLSWRIMATDTAGVEFNLYRDSVLVNPIPITGISNYIDSSGTAGSIYYLQTISARGDTSISTPVIVWEKEYLTIPTQTPDGYTLNDASMADLDGDGELEIVVKMERSSRDNSQSGFTDPVFLHAYRLNGDFLWSIDLGINIRAGAHYTQFMVYDLDGDGKAEVACKTAPGTKDATGAFLKTGPAANDDDTADYRNSSGYILQGPEYLTVFEGTSGTEVSTVHYLPPRYPSTEFPTGSQINSLWGDSYGNRVDRFLAGVAYFEEKPSLVMCRGYYTRTALTAYDFNGDTLAVRWIFDTQGNPSLNTYKGQGAHSLSIGDVDKDGKDEIMYGAMAVDDDGSPLYSTTYGHGDATHLSDLVPSNPGLEFFMPHETAGRFDYGSTNPTLHVRDAATGNILWEVPGEGDIGRGLTADISPDHPGNEFWASGRHGVYNSSGEVISSVFPAINFAIWWDGDLSREILDKNNIQKWTPNGMQDLLIADGATSNNGTKSTPCLSGDILGDWREEVILRAADNQSLRIYTTSIPTSYGFYTLLQDPQYRLALTWQNVAYNQPPHPGFFLGNDMETPPIPSIEVSQPSTALNILAPYDGYELALGLDLNVIVHAVALAETNPNIILSLNGSPVDTIVAPPYHLSISDLPSGEYELIASAYSTNGQMVHSPPKTFIIDEGFPKITLLSPSEGEAYLPSETILLAANASDPNGSVDSVVFLINHTPVETVFAPPFEISLANPGLGLHTAQAIVYDNDGNFTESPSVGFEVSMPAIIQENEIGFCGFSEGSGSIDNDNAGFTGFGFANTNNIPGVQINWAVDFADGGTYRMEFRYASAENRPGLLILDDTDILDTVLLNNTGGWTSWSTSSVIINAPAGLHKLSLKALANNGLANIDYLNARSLTSTNAAEGINCDSLVLSIENEIGASQIDVYPIPASQYIDVQLQNTQDAIEEIVIYQMSGKQLLRKKGNKSQQMRMNLPKLAHGVYLIRVRTIKGVFVKKFQVQS